MSPHAANSLVHDLVQMAQAMEQLPQVRDELAATQSDLASASATIQRLETKLMDRANEVTTLLGKIRELEVARDDAEYRFLEAEDRTSRALDFIKATFGNAGSLIQALEPPKPQPPAEPVQVPEHITSTDYASQSEPIGGDGGSPNEGVSVLANPTSAHTLDSEPKLDTPISATTDTSDASTAAHSSTEGVSVSPESQSAGDTPKAGPYSGKRYLDVPGYISPQEWLDGGGDEAGYSSLHGIYR